MEVVEYENLPLYLRTFRSLHSPYTSNLKGPKNLRNSEFMSMSAMKHHSKDRKEYTGSETFYRLNCLISIKNYN